MSGTAPAPPTSPLPRKPAWLKVPLAGGGAFAHVRETLQTLQLHSVCREALCPNISECFQEGTATFLILGNICTRNCRYCHVSHGAPGPPDAGEPEHLIEAVRRLGLQYVVITSVTRDDLADGGAESFARCVEGLRCDMPGCRVEVLIPDFQKKTGALERILASGPDVINHNMEVVPRLFKDIRPEGSYAASLALLKEIREGEHRTARGERIFTKSGFMVGFGESPDDIRELLEDLAGVRCDYLTVGQYQQPTRDAWPVVKYYSPDEFAEIRRIACSLGFQRIEAGPRVRSSYHAARMAARAEEAEG
jgi:lipoic acid synthetase